MPFIRDYMAAAREIPVSMATVKLMRLICIFDKYGPLSTSMVSLVKIPLQSAEIGPIL